MKKGIRIALILLCFGISAHAQTTEKVYTQDGAIYEGYISEQIPGERICVYATKATRIVPKDDVVNLTTVYRPIELLPYSLQNMFRANGDSVSVKLSTFEYKGDVIDDVHILSDDGNEIRFVSFALRTYILPWGSINKTEKIVPPQENYGIKDIITLKDGKQLIGAILEQNLGKTVTIKTENDSTEIVQSEEILSFRSECIDSSTSLWKQTLFLDRILVEDNGKTREIEGFIVARVLGEKLVMLDKNTGQEESISLNRILKYRKLYNKDYVPYVVPVVDLTPRVLVNGRKTDLMLTTRSENRVHVNMEGNQIFTSPCAEKFTIDIYNIECNAAVKLYLATRPDENDSIRVPYIMETTQPLYGGDISTVDESHKQCTISVSEPGLYYLSIRDLNSVLVILVK